MNNAESKARVSRRNMLTGAAMFVGAAGISTATPSLTAAPAIIPSKTKFHPIVALSSKNVVETESGKVYGYSRDGVIGYRGLPYAATTENAGRFMPPAKVKPWAGVRSSLYWGWTSPQTITVQSEADALLGLTTMKRSCSSGTTATRRKIVSISMSGLPQPIPGSVPSCSGLTGLDASG